MFKATFTRFYLLLIVALFIGFIAVELGTSVEPTAMVTLAQSPGTVLNAPHTNLIFLFIGIGAGVVIIGTLLFIYNEEKNRMY